MGPRPPRHGDHLGVRPPAPPGQARLVVVERVSSRVVVKPVSRHMPDTDPLPVVAALAAIATDLRHLPRDAIGDVGELLLWLRRMAGRVDGVATLRITRAQPRPKRNPNAVADLASAVFGSSSSRGGAASRTVTSRRGRQIAVETRRARDRGQMDLPW